MAIQVTCAKCLTRFSVSDKFAGQEGPCPKCKTKIRVPDASESVKVHAPTAGPTDSKGRAVAKPIFREQQPITAVHWTIAGCFAFVLLAVAVVARYMFQEAEGVPYWAMASGATLVAFPMAFLGYALLRDPEAGSYHGSELWTRVAICAISFAILWVLSPIMVYAFSDTMENPGAVGQGVAIAGLIFAGGGVSLLCFDFDYLMGLVHAGVYVVPCILMRLLAGLQAIPGLSSLGTPAEAAPDAIPNFGLLIGIFLGC